MPSQDTDKKHFSAIDKLTSQSICNAYQTTRNAPSESGKAEDHHLQYYSLLDEALSVVESSKDYLKC